MKFEGSLKWGPIEGCLWMDEDGEQDEGENVSLPQRIPHSAAKPHNGELSIFCFK